MPRLIGILVLCMLPFSASIADGGKITIPQNEELNLTYKKSDQKKMDKARLAVEKALTDINQIEALYHNVTEDSLSEINKEAFVKLKEVSDQLQEANEIRFEINRKYIENFWKTIKALYVKELAKAKTLEIESIKFYRTAQNRRQQALLTRNYTKAYNALADAIEQELLAIQRQSRALRKYQDWPVVYPYVWEDNVKPYDPTIKIVVAQTDTTPSNQNVAVNTPTQMNEIVEEDIAAITFKVQIAAHTNPIAKEELAALYKGPVKIDMIYEDGWYKYSIGAFQDDIIQAQILLRQCNVPKAFIVAYQNGKKLKIKEAIKLSNERLMRNH
jgi:hypothetical protein